MLWSRASHLNWALTVLNKIERNELFLELPHSILILYLLIIFHTESSVNGWHRIISEVGYGFRSITISPRQ